MVNQATSRNQGYALSRPAAPLHIVADGDRLLTLREAEDAYIGGLFNVPYAEAFKSHSPLLVASPTVFLPEMHG
jgi:hypothetical protein